MAKPKERQEDKADGQMVAYYMRHGLARIPFWQFMGLVIMLQIIWVNELVDFSALFLGRETSPPNIVRGCLLSAGVMIVAIITVGHSYLLQQRVVRGLLTVCSYCHRIRLNRTAWEQIEAYISRHSEIRFSHGICPECYEKVSRELELSPEDEEGEGGEC